MKKLLYILCIVLLFAASAQAQIKLMGVTPNSSNNSIDLVQWTMFDEASVVTLPTELDYYLFASSAFNSFSGNYYIAGGFGSGSGLYSYNTETEESNLSTGATLTSIAEFDMSTGKMYNLIIETEEYIDIYEYDIANSAEVLIGSIYEPGVLGIVADAIAFDSNNGIIYYVGMTSSGPLALYAVSVRAEAFSYTRTDLITPTAGSTITGVNYDNVNEKLFATNDTFDENGNSLGRAVVEIDFATGEVTTLGVLNDFPYFLGGSAQFDQITGNYLLVGVNSNNQAQMIAFDTATNTYQAGFVPSASEIVCNNTFFARSTYIDASIESLSKLKFNVYPNPASDRLNIELDTNGPVQVEMINALGELVYTANLGYTGVTSIDVSPFSSGLYSLTVRTINESMTKSVVVH